MTVRGLDAHTFASLSPDERNLFLNSLTPEEAQLLEYDWYFWARPEQLPPVGNWRNWLVMAGRGWGKALCVNTPIPTPKGFTRLEDIQPGDSLFDELGQPTRVLATYDSFPTQAYRLHFSDSTYLDVCAEHQWTTWTHQDRKEYLRSVETDSTTFPLNWPNWRPRGTTHALPEDVIAEAERLLAEGTSMRKVALSVGHTRQALSRHIFHPDTLKSPTPTPTLLPNGAGPRVRTTQQIIDTFTYSSRGDTNHCIPLAHPLILPDQPLLIDPYILGYWLGDGASKDGSFTADPEDQPNLYRELKRAGYDPHPTADPITVATYGLYAHLRQLDVLKNKHVPQPYLRASYDQRLALLQGLMDSDGYAEASKVEFCSTHLPLAKAVLELARTLGQKPRLYFGRATLNGQDCGDKYRVVWNPTLNPFHLPRKSSNHHQQQHQNLRNHHRMIVNYESIQPVPMRCLTVDSPNSIYLAGESFIPTHNTRTGAEFIRMRQEAGYSRFALVGATAADVRDVMIEGQSGIISCCPPHNRPIYEPSKRKVVWPNGAFALAFSADTPERLRGPQFDTAYCDELAAWPYANTFTQLQFCMRLSNDPRVIITTTPRPVPILREIMKSPTTHTTFGKTIDNAANLPQAYLEHLLQTYQGSRLGQQELEGILLDNVAGALWKREWIDYSTPPSPEELTRIVVAVDPTIATNSPAQQERKGYRDTNECGIIVVATQNAYPNALGYVLDDMSIKGSPNEWAQQVVKAYDYYKADRVVAEINQGGNLIESLLRTIRPNIPYTPVSASRGKTTRAEPVAALYEQRRIFHARPFPELEDQLTQWARGTDSPDRLDALVWGFSHLMVQENAKRLPYVLIQAIAKTHSPTH